jgi:hypothetical protein
MDLYIQKKARTMPSFNILNMLFIFNIQKMPAAYEGVKLPTGEEDVPAWALFSVLFPNV